MLNSSWIGDAVTGVGDGLFSGSVRVGVSNKTVETDPEFKKSSLSLSLPAGREDDSRSYARCSQYPHLWAIGRGFNYVFLGESPIGEGTTYCFLIQLPQRGRVEAEGKHASDSKSPAPCKGI